MQACRQRTHLDTTHCKYGKMASFSSQSCKAGNNQTPIPSLVFELHCPLSAAILHNWSCYCYRDNGGLPVVSYQGFSALLSLPSDIKLEYLCLSLTEDPHRSDNTGSCWLLICQNLVATKNTDTRGIRSTRSGDIPRPCLLALPLDFK